MAQRRGNAQLFLLTSILVAALLMLLIFAYPRLQEPQSIEMGGEARAQRGWPGVWPVTLNDTRGIPVMMAWESRGIALEPGGAIQVSMAAEIMNSVTCGGAAHAAVQIGPIIIGIYPESRPPAPCELGGNTDVYLVVSGPGVYDRIRLGDVCHTNHYTVNLYVWEDCEGVVHIQYGSVEWRVRLDHPQRLPIAADTVRDANPHAFWCNPSSSVTVDSVGRSECPVENSTETPTEDMPVTYTMPSGTVSFGRRPDEGNGPSINLQLPGVNIQLDYLYALAGIMVLILVFALLAPMLPTLLAAAGSSLRARAERLARRIASRFRR